MPRRWKRLASAVIGLLLIATGSALGGVEGRLETVIQTDNRLNETRFSVVERGDFIYRDREKDTLTALSFAARWRDNNGDARVYQLYIEKGFDDTRLKAGRYERAAASGYYILDGATLKKERGLFSVNLYGGVPVRIDDYISRSGDSLYGIEVGFAKGERVASGSTKKSCKGTVGYERFKDGDAIERVTWGIGGRVTKKTARFDSWQIYTGGTYIPKSGLLENLLAEVRGDFKNGGVIRAAYEIYEPDDEFLSLRDRFYRFYSRGREEVIRGGLHYSPLKGVRVYGKGRRVMHESGTSGFGGTLGTDISKASGIDLGGEVDYLYLEGEKALSLLLSSRKSPGPRTLMVIEGIWQLQQKRTTGKNRGVGLEAELKRMMKSNLFLSAYAMHIWNSRMDDEYRGGVRLSWSFNQKGKK